MNKIFFRYLVLVFDLLHNDKFHSVFIAVEIQSL